MKSIQNILQTNGEEFMNNLMNDYLVVYEKLNASTLSFRRIKNELHFYKGRDNEEINSVNETLYTYFKEGIEYIKRVSLIFYMEFPEGWLFRMQYFNPNAPCLVNYEQQPKNNLVLSCIDTGNSIIEDLNVLKRWSDKLQIDVSEPLFCGFLSEFQKEKLMDYVNGNADYEGITFSQYIISLLNPALKHSAYSDTFNTGIDSFVFKFYNTNYKKCVPLKLVDPYMDKLVQQNKDKFGNNLGTENEIILVNFIAWLQTIDLKNIKVSGKTNDERYMDLLCKLFNRYMEKEQKMYDSMKSSVNESYGVDIEKIENPDTVKLLKNNPAIEKAFQVIVGSFMNQKDNIDPMSIMNDTLKDMFNKEVEDIKKITNDKEEKILSFSDLMNKNANNIEKSAEKTTDKKVMSFTELMDEIGYSKPEEKEVEPENPIEKHDSEKKEIKNSNENDTNKEKETSENSKEKPKENSESEKKEEITKASKEEPKEDKEDSKDTDKEEPKEDKEDSKDTDKEEPKEDKEDSKDTDKEEPKEDKEDSKDTDKEEPKEDKEASKDTDKEEPKEDTEASKDTDKEEPKEDTKDSKDTDKEEPKEKSSDNTDKTKKEKPEKHLSKTKEEKEESFSSNMTL